MNTFTLALKQLRSAWRSGEVRVLLVALVLAVGAMSAVGFFADRIQSALLRQGASLLGGDLMIVADHPLPATFAAEAHRRGLKTVQGLEFPSMVMHGEEGRLAEIKAVETGYPLRGRLRVADRPYAPERVAQGVPAQGEVWIEPRLASLLGVEEGDVLAVGARDFRIAAILQQDSARGGDLFSFAPRLLMQMDDVPATGLIQTGSRISYRLLAAGEARAVQGFATWTSARLARGERLENVTNARPEIRSALEKTQQFLGLAAMAGAILALVAMVLATAQFARRQLDACALMRCFGASQGTITRIFLYQAMLLGLLGSLTGCALGYAAQEVLAQLAGHLFLETLPPPGWAPAWSGIAAGVAALLGVMFPQLLRLRGVPALRILRRDLGNGYSGRAIMSALAWLPGLAVFLALIFWSARDAKLGVILLGGLVGLLLAATLMSLMLGALLRRLLASAGGAWRLGLANLLRRPAVSATQVAGFGLGIMAMLLLTIVRGDLLQSWQASLPSDAPNRFTINLQPDQLARARAFFAEEHLAEPALHPMVRGRLVAINGQTLNTSHYQDERARHLAEREFNLSWAASMQADNRIVAGRWWRASEHGQRQLSLEQGIAETLGIRLGDSLAYDIGGTRIELQVTSLRKVEWDTLRPNFFAVTPPGVLEELSVSYMTGFYLAAGQEEVLNRLVKRFPNVTVIDVAAILEQVRGIMDRMAYAVQFVFAFCLLSGVAVLYAALVATRDERLREAALLRVFGASRRQVAITVLAEFALIGLLAGAMATVGASLLAWFIGERLLHLPYAFDPVLALLALASGGLLVPAAAWLGLRHIVRQPPRLTLQSS